MTQLAADLVDHVIPFVPVRQFVLSFPHRLRYLLAYNHARAIGVIRICIRTIMSFYRRRAKRKGLADGRTGSVTFIQRFGSAANLNLHAHVLMLDGVFIEKNDGELQFQRAAPLRDQEIHTLLIRIRKRVLRHLHRQGVLENEYDIDPFSDESPVLASCYATSIGGRQMLGERPGSKLQRVGHDPHTSWIQSRGPLQAHIDGFDLHAKLTIASHTKKGRLPLEKIARYCARPPISQDRLSQLHDGRVSLELKTRWHDGTTHVLYSPLDFLARLAALIPAPRKNLVLYHGVLAPNSRWRQRAVTYRRPIDSESAQRPRTRLEEDKVAPPRIRRSWAELMLRAFGFDLLTCPNCSSKMTLIACILERSAIRKILTHLALPDELPTLTPARPPPGSEAAIDYYA